MNPRIRTPAPGLAAVRSSAAVVLLWLCVGCPHRAIVEAVDHDLNNDGHTDVRVCVVNHRPWVKFVDLNLDGQVDVVCYFDSRGKLVHMDIDADRDGTFDWFDDYCREPDCAVLQRDPHEDAVAWWSRATGIQAQSACSQALR